MKEKFEIARESGNGVTNQGQRMTSLEIAQLTGKQHKHVMEAIRKMEPAWEKVRGSNFRLSSRILEMPNGGVREYPCYELTKVETLYIATKFNDEARARLVLRWEQLEMAERERWMAQQTGRPTIDLRGSKGAQVFFIVPAGGTMPVPMRLIEYRPYHGPVRDLLARTAHGIVREGTDDYTLYVRISKDMCEAVDVTPREMFEHEIRQLLSRI
ncbi:MAG: Rha family transcriptional regulator [Bacteroidaceae bacterium]|nr:Rha family transcriptional regulator [Bacteroidaceae bacterium]